MADAKQKDEQESGGGKKKMILIIVGALLLVAISVGLTVMLVGGDSEQPEAVAEEPVPVKGDATYIELKPFTVNLDPDDPVHFLQVQIQVLTYYPEVSADLEKHKPLIRNHLALLCGKQKSQDLRSPEGKQVFQKQVLETIQGIVDKYGSGGEVANVFFSNFVMQ